MLHHAGSYNRPRAVRTHEQVVRQLGVKTLLVATALVNTGPVQTGIWTAGRPLDSPILRECNALIVEIDLGAPLIEVNSEQIGVTVSAAE
jgi:hypothetical protein